MDITGIGQAIRNVGRIREILGVLYRHGYGWFIRQIGLDRYLPGRLKGQEAEGGDPEHLRRAFEELGPTFIKLGQLLGSRPDILPPAYMEAFGRLQDRVAPFSAAEARATIEASLGVRLEERFRSFEEAPLAAASIAQVHRAVLKDGTPVVVKVQRPGLQEVIDTDMSILTLLATAAERYYPPSRVFEPIAVVEEFARSIRQELDFSLEGFNTERMARNFTGDPDIVLPKVFWESTGRQVLTMEEIRGIKISEVDRLKAAGVDPKAVVRMGTRAFLKMVLVHGFFHGDLHAGNIFVLPPEGKRGKAAHVRIAMVDFGIVGRVDDELMERMASIFLAVLERDYARLVREYVALSTQRGGMDRKGFQRELAQILDPHLGRPLGDVNIGEVLTQGVAVASKYRIRVPRDLILLSRAIVTIESLGRRLDPSFDLLSESQTLARALLQRKFSPDRMAREAVASIQDLRELARTAPRVLVDLMEKLEAEEFRIGIVSKELDRVGERLTHASSRISLALLASGLLVGGALTLGWREGPVVSGIPVSGAAGVAGAFALTTLLFWSIWRSK